MDDSVAPPPIDAEAIHRVDDDRYNPGNVCIVTGAASGIGRATALAIAGNGLTVIATDIDTDGLEATAERAAALDLPGSVHTVGGDLAETDDLDGIIDAATDLGDVRFLANIAGIQHVAPLESFPMDVYDHMQAVMVRAPMYLSQQTLPLMRAAGGGCIGNMASVHGRYVTRDKVAYNVAKFGLRGLTQSIAAEGDGDVRSFSISTGYVATPLVTDQLADTADQRDIDPEEVVAEVMLGDSPMDDMLNPIDVANLFVIGFSHLARHLNGGDMLHDGGMSLTYE